MVTQTPNADVGNTKGLCCSYPTDNCLFICIPNNHGAAIGICIGKMQRIAQAVAYRLHAICLCQRFCFLGRDKLLTAGTAPRAAACRKRNSRRARQGCHFLNRFSYKRKIRFRSCVIVNTVQVIHHDDILRPCRKIILAIGNIGFQ